MPEWFVQLLTILFNLSNMHPLCFSRFVCVLLNFRAREFPVKSKIREPGGGVYLTSSG